MEAGLVGELGGLNIMQTDYNNDGFPDVLVLRGGWFGTEGHFPKSLLRNNGDGTFEDVTESAGLLSLKPSQTAVWFDYDNDGWVDLFVGYETKGEAKISVSFFTTTETARSPSARLNRAWVILGGSKAFAVPTSTMMDGPICSFLFWEETRFSFAMMGPTTNSNGKVVWGFTDVTKQAGIEGPDYSFPCWFFDYDNDGWDDLFACGYHISSVGDVCADYLGLPTDAERPRLYHNNHNGTFTDVTREAGLYHVLLAMGSNFGDLDNDGFLDFYLGTGESRPCRHRSEPNVSQ